MPLQKPFRRSAHCSWAWKAIAFSIVHKHPRVSGPGRNDQMDCGLGFVQHPCPILKFPEGLCPVSARFSKEKPNQKKNLSMGVVPGLLCASEAMAQMVVPLSLAFDSGPTKGCDSGWPLLP